MLVLQKEVNTKLKNKMANTEKPTKIAEKKKNIVEKTKQKAENVPKEVAKKKEEKKVEGKKEETKKPVKKEEKPKKKKTEVIVNVSNLPISTKKSRDLCRFIKYKRIGDAIADLEQVSRAKKPVPMKGEIPHRKGIMSGGFPKKASENFIVLLKSLSANANANELEDPVIVEAIANIGVRPYGRFGRIRKKRTHVKIKAKEKKWKKKT